MKWVHFAFYRFSSSFYHTPCAIYRSERGRERRQRTNPLYFKNRCNLVISIRTTAASRLWIHLRNWFHHPRSTKWLDHKVSVRSITEHHPVNSSSSDFLNLGTSSVQPSSIPTCSVSNAVGSDPARMAEFLGQQSWTAKPQPKLETIAENLPISTPNTRVKDPRWSDNFDLPAFSFRCRWSMAVSRCVPDSFTSLFICVKKCLI